MPLPTKPRTSCCNAPTHVRSNLVPVREVTQDWDLDRSLLTHESVFMGEWQCHLVEDHHGYYASGQHYKDSFTCS